jgi:uncharacterized protein DUF6516
MKATLLFHSKTDDACGNITEIRIWRVTVTEHTPYGFKYSLVYIERDVRIIGYDNERGKGGHRHFDGEETPYYFIDVDTLIEDFSRDIAQWRGEL